MSVPADTVSLPEAERRGALTPEERRAWYGFIAMSFGAFMAFLDIQIVASSLNQIQAGLAATPTELAWVQSAYLIAEVIAIPLSGYLTRMMSTRVYYTVSVLGFTLASALCAMAWSIESMILFRALQGFLGGGMIPCSFAAMYALFPSPKKRLVPQVVAGITMSTAPVLGPIIGGWITDATSWHWLFLINLLPGLAVALLVWQLVRIDRPDWALWRSIDLRGSAYMALFLGSMQWVLEEGPAHNWLDDDAIATWATVCLVSGLMFFHRVATHDNPIVSLKPFRDRHVLWANIAALFLSISLFATNYIVPVFLGQLRDFTSQQIGNTLTIGGLSMFMAAPFAARLTRKYDMRLLFAFGAMLVAIGSWLMTDLTADTGFAELALPQFLRGAGFMLALVCCSTLSLCTLPMDQLKNASAMYSLMRNLGGALGLASINTIIFWRRAVHEQNLTEALSLSRAPVRDFVVEHGGWTRELPMPLVELAMRIERQVSVLTYNDALIMIAWVSVLAVPMLLFTSRYNLTENPQTEAAH